MVTQRRSIRLVLLIIIIAMVMLIAVGCTGSSVKIKFDSDGGSDVSSLTIKPSETTVVALPTPEKDGYTFEGWFTDESKTTPFNINNVPTEDITLYALWAIRKIEISFWDEVNNKTINVEVDHGGSIMGRLPPVPIKTGYLGSWDIEEEALSNITEAFSVNATYVLKIYTMTFVEQPTVDPIVITGFMGEDYEKPENPTLKDYVFAGWYTDTSYASPYVFPSVMPTADITLYAWWIKESELGDYFVYEATDYLGDSATAIRITGITRTASYHSNILVPSTIENLPVKYIGYDTPYQQVIDQNSSDLHTVFNSTYLKSIIISNSIENIGAFAFSKASQLTSISFLDGSALKKIGDAAFSNCIKLEEVYLPPSVETIGDYAFAAIDLPEGSQMLLSIFNIENNGNLSVMGKSVFNGCRLLENFRIPKSMDEQIRYQGPDIDFDYGFYRIFEGAGIKAFTTEAGHTTLSANAGVIYSIDGTTLYYYPNAASSVFVIPTGTRKIGENAFRNNSQLQNVHISELVDTIMGYAFYKATNLATITFAQQSALMYINKYAFAGAKSLSTINFPTTLKEIHDFAFSAIGEEEMALENIQLPQGLASIGANAFRRCAKLKNIVLPLSLITIDDYAFYDCNNLSILYPEDYNLTDSLLETIGDYAFYRCYNIINLQLPPTLLEIGNYAFANSAGNSTAMQLRNLTIASNTMGYRSLHTIGDSAFENCINLEQFNISENVSSIGKRAFYNCKAIRVQFNQHPINNVLQKIEDETFYGCTTLSIIVIPRTVTEIGDFAFYGNTSLVTVQSGGTQLSLIKTIGNSAFEGCTKLVSSVTIANQSILFPNVDTVGKRAFYGCSALDNIRIVNSLNTIGEEAFAYCTSLSTILYGNNPILTNLPKDLFKGCNSLTNFRLPNSVTTIDGNPFSSCNNLVGFTVEQSNPNFEAVFSIQQNYNVLYYKSLPKTIALFPTGIETQFEVPSDVERIAEYAFYSSKVTRLTFSGGSTGVSIGDFAFAESKRLSQINLSKRVNSIGNYAFYNCTFLSAIDIEEDQYLNPLNIGGYAFGYTPISQIIIPERIKTIGEYAFNGCYRLEQLSFVQTANPSVDLEINQYAFYEASKIKELLLPSRLTNIGNNAFSWCVSLKEIEFADSNRNLSLGDSVFENCHLMKTISLPSRLIEMGSYVFMNCSSLESFEIQSRDGGVYTPEALEVGEHAFSGCYDLRTVIIPEHITKLGDYAFYNCYNLVEIIFKDSSIDLEIGSYAFSECGAIESFEIPARTIFIGDYAFYGSGLGKQAVLAVKDNSSVVAYSSHLTFADSDKELVLGEYCFANTNISNINLPSRITEIGKFAFANNKNLLLIEFEEGSKCIFIGEGAFENIATSTLASSAVKYERLVGYNKYVYSDEIYKIRLPDSLVELGKSVFKNSQNILQIVLNEGFMIIGEGAFYGLTKITHIDLPSSVTTIGDSAFFGCKSLQNINIMNDRDYSIGSYAFSGCESLSSLSLKMVSMIGFAPAYGCNNLTLLTVDNNNPYYKTIGSVLFTKNVTYGSGEDEKTYTEDEMILLYPAGKQGSTYAINNKTRELGPKAFSGNKYLTSITIDALDSSVLKIAEDSFQDTAIALEFFVPSTSEFSYKQNIMWRQYSNKIKSSAESVENFIIEVIPGDSQSCRIVKYIGLADSGDNLIIPITLKGLKVKEIGANAFSYNSILRSIRIPQGVTKIANNAFSNCVALTTIIISDSVQEIGEYAFYGCTNLKNVQFGENSLLSNISNYAFQQCISLENINLPWRIASIGIFAFAGSSDKLMNLKTISIPSNSILRSIGSYAFQYASSLNSVTIPQSVTMLGMNIFFGCSSLTSVILERGVNQSITELQNENVFAGTPTELMIYVPAAARQEYVKARYWKNLAVRIGETESLNNQYSLENIIYYYSAIRIVQYLGVPNPDNISYNLSYQSNLALPEMAIKLPIVTINSTNKTFAHKIKGVTITNNYTNFVINQTQTISLYDSSLREHRLIIERLNIAIPGIRLLKYLGADTEITIPSQIQGKPVLEIGSYCFNYKIISAIVPEGILKINNNAFRYSSGLRTIKLPMSLSIIESNAFNGNALEYVHIGNNETELLASRLIEIGDYAFYGCTSLARFLVPPEVDRIGNYAFAMKTAGQRMSLDEVIFYGKKMNIIGRYAFLGTNISTITLPEQLTTIGEGAFKNCNYLLSVYLNDNSSSNVVVRLEQGALEVFGGCDFVKVYVKSNKLVHYRSSEGTWSKLISRIFSSANTYDGFSISIIDNDARTAELVHYIGQETNVVVPAQINDYTIQTISTYVFNYNVRTVSLPNTVRTISSYAFYKSGVEQVSFASGSIVTLIGEYAFYSTQLHTVEIPRSVTNIGQYAFANTRLSNITFEGAEELVTEGENITPGLVIGGYVFSNNKDLTNINLPRRTLSIGQYIFYNNTNLYNINLPLNGQLASILSYAFSYCTSLEEITIPFSVTQLFTSVFDNCNSLKSVFIMRGRDGGDITEVDGLTTTGPGMFNNIGNPFLKVYVPRNSINEYKNLANWKSYSGYSESGLFDPLTYPDYIVPNLIFGDFAYNILDASSIELTKYRGSEIDLVLPGSITIGTITYNVKSIGRHFGNSKIRSVVMETGHRQQINIYAFSDCISLEKVTLPSSIEIILAYAFNNCLKLRTINIPENIADINQGVFRNCRSLKEIHLPSTIINIREFAFQNCTSLVRMHLNTPGIIEGGGSMLMNSSLYLRIFVANDYVLPYRTKTIWSQYATSIISRDTIYGNFAIEILQNGQINILQYIGYEKDMYVPERLQGRLIASIAANSIINVIEKIYLPEGSTVTYSGGETMKRILYY